MSSDFYDRQRRLAYVFAALSVALLLFYLLGLGFLLETYAAPRAAAAGEDLVASWATRSADDESGTRVVRLDDALRPRGPAWRLGGEAGAVLAADEELTAYFGNRYSVLRGGSTVRGAELAGQPWAVLAACADPARGADWIFGVHDGKLLARRRELGTYSESLPAAAAGTVERLTASIEGAAGPLLAWRETGAAVVKTALWDGRQFAAGPDFDVGPVEHWDVVLAGGGPLLLTYSREDRTFRELGLRLRRPGEAATTAVFPDPILLLGKKVTGLAAAVRGDRLAIVVARWTALQAASVPLSTLVPEPGARLVPIDAEPRWRALVGFFFPVALMFFSFSLVFLGYSLLRERSGFVLERLVPVEGGGPPPAAILQRAMAFILDQIALFPPVAVAVEVLNVSPEVWDLEHPRLYLTIGVYLAIAFVYHVLMEGLLGWTLGKKVVGIRVAALDGSPAGLGRSLVRNLIRPLDASWPLGVFLGMSLMMTTRRRQRLGDLAARTLVVEERPAPAPAPPERRLKAREPRV
jgi:uncharacterized RDD family membrane protein YckC